MAKLDDRSMVKPSVLRWALFTVVFTALSVVTPWITHQFSLAGSVFLPMHFFVLVAGLLFGWRVGLSVGIMSPLVSYFISGMPIVSHLPFITFEIATYGLFIGLLYKKWHFNLWVSLLSAMLIGRIILGLAVYIIGFKLGPIDYVINVVNLGWLGILIQVAFIPLLVKWLGQYMKGTD